MRYRLEGTVTLTVTAEWETPAIPPTDAEAVAALQSTMDAHADRTFDDVSLHLSSTATTALDEDESSPTGTLYADLVDLTENAQMTISGRATVHIEETLGWDGEPPEERVRDILADTAPGSVLSVEDVTIDTVEPIQTAE